MQLKTVNKEIARVMNGVDIEMTRLAARIRREHVVPLCKRKGWGYSAGKGLRHGRPGMGTWSFFDRDGVTVWDKDIPPAVVRILDAEVYNGQIIGFWVEPVERGA